jgi:hypothetical protein
MEYAGTSQRLRVRVVAKAGWLAKYEGQECDAIFYSGAMPQIDTEQLKPPMPRWQSASAADLEVIR